MVKADLINKVLASLPAKEETKNEQWFIRRITK
jgi:hypothetical protein